MKLRYFVCAVLAFAFASVSLHFRAQTSPSDPYLTAHEWGTFTSIAGKNGLAAEWTPLTGSTDLPSFVEHYRTANFKLGLRGTVRMETPVLYFYTNRETTVSVHVSFSKGLITEWYPHANRVEPEGLFSQVSYANDLALTKSSHDGSISWDSVKLEPRSFSKLPVEARANHYYAARETSATPLRISIPQGNQTEKFLFYRGVSTMSVPISAKLQPDEKVLSENLTSQLIPAMLLFERRGEKLGFRVINPSTTETVLDRPELNGDMNSLKQTIIDTLVGQGLYQDEAQAMFETWQDSWFEEGSRLLYIVPRQFVDSILPLSIQPMPSQTVRVFVGRIELTTHTTLNTVEQALATRDRVTLARYGRFLLPILDYINANDRNRFSAKQIDEYYVTAYSVGAPQPVLKTR